MLLRMSRNHGFSAVVIAVMLLVAPACSSSPSAPTTTGPFVVAGRVLDYQTNAGVAGATVSFGDLLSAAVLPGDPRSVSDGSGSYQVTLMPGEYHVWIDNTYRGLARVRSGANRADLLVHDAGCTALYGTIADARTGRSIAGATLSLVGVTGISDSIGAYRLELGCRGFFAFTGTIAMSVTRTGYQNKSVPMGRGEGLNYVLRQDVDLDPQ